MTVSAFAGPYFTDGGDSALRRSLERWVYAHPGWTHTSVSQGVARLSTPRELAQRFVDDPGLQAVLAALTSPIGQAIEEAALSTWMSPVEAELMTVALTKAWKTVQNRSLPVWRRTEVLVGGVCLVVVVGLIAYAVHHPHQPNNIRGKQSPGGRAPQARRTRQRVPKKRP